MRYHHGLSKDTDYLRLNSIHQRCYNKKNKSYPRYGGRGIKVCYEWHKSNPHGVTNFMSWVEAQLKIMQEKAPAQYDSTKYKVVRNNIDLDFSPDNCSLSTNDASCQKRITSVLNFNIVVNLRKYKKLNPSASLSEMRKLFNHSIENISRALRGITWSNVDSVETPVESIKQQRKKHE